MNASSSRVVLEPAWVLHRRPYRETSEIADLFTAAHGRIAAVARGSRRGRRRSPLEPFQPLHVSWTGRGEMVTLTGAEPRGPVLQADGHRLLSMFYINELVLRLTEKQDPHPEVFVAYEETVYDLAMAPDEAPVLRRFERDLLEALGYGLLLDRDVNGREVAAGSLYAYRLEEGPRKLEAADRTTMVVSGDTLLAIQSGRFEGRTQLREARMLLTAAVDHYLGGRPLKTRQVLNSLLARTSGSAHLAK